MNLKLQSDNSTPKGDRHRIWRHGSRMRGGHMLRLIECETGQRVWTASTNGISYSDEHSKEFDCKALLRRHAARLENLARTIEVLEERLDAGKQPWKLIKVDEVTWDKLDVDVRIARFLYAEISDFKASCHGTPMVYFSPERLETWEHDESTTEKAHEAYLADLDKICATFRFAGWSEDNTHDQPEGYQEGLDLFAKLFGSLWH